MLWYGSRDPTTGAVSILIGSELRKNKLVLSCLAGKRENNDAGPEHTAWREFWEESGKVTLVLCCVLLCCCAVPCCAVLCCAVLCCSILCRAVLCGVVLVYL